MFWTITKIILWPLFKVLYRFSAGGVKNVPTEGPVLIVANHTSYLDPIIIGLGARRPVKFMAKEELFKVPGLAWAIRWLEAFPVKRGSFDRRAVQKALAILEAGEMVGLFPQGGRGRSEVNEAYPGAAFLAYKSGAVVVPAAIKGADKVMPPGGRFPRFPKIRVDFGSVIEPDTVGNRKEVVEKLTARIVGELRKMLSEGDMNEN